MRAACARHRGEIGAGQLNHPGQLRGIELVEHDNAGVTPPMRRLQQGHGGEEITLLIELVEVGAARQVRTAPRTQHVANRVAFAAEFLGLRQLLTVAGVPAV